MSIGQCRRSASSRQAPADACRFGGITSPLVAGFLIGLGSLTLVWCIISAGMLLAAGLTFLLAYETRGNLELVSRGAA